MIKVQLIQDMAIHGQMVAVVCQVGVLCQADGGIKISLRPNLQKQIQAITLQFLLLRESNLLLFLYPHLSLRRPLLLVLRLLVLPVLDEVRQRLSEIGFEAVGSAPEEFAAFQRAEIDRWRKVIETGGIKPE